MARDHPERAPWAPPATNPFDGPSEGAVALAVLDEDPPSGPPARIRVLEIFFLAGLAGVFLVNAVAAVVQPSDFTTLVDQSTVAHWLHLAPGDWLVPLIFVNDLVIGIGLLCAIGARHAVRVVILAWAGVWFFAVTVVKLTALDAFP